jgi:hypothetical protein
MTREEKLFFAQVLELYSCEKFGKDEKNGKIYCEETSNGVEDAEEYGSMEA